MKHRFSGFQHPKNRNVSKVKIRTNPSFTFRKIFKWFKIKSWMKENEYFCRIMSISMKLRAVLACLLSGMRFTLAGLLLVPIMMIDKVNMRNYIRHWKFMLLFAFLQIFLQYGIFFLGLNCRQNHWSIL